MQILKQIGQALLAAILTESFIKELVVFLLERLSAKTDNTIDDEIVAKIKKSLKVE